MSVGSPQGLESAQGMGKWEAGSARALWKSLSSAPKLLCSGVFIKPRSLTLQPLLCGAVPWLQQHKSGLQDPVPLCWILWGLMAAA